MYAVSSSDDTSSLETVKLLLVNGAETYGALDECPTYKCQKIISKNIWSIIREGKVKEIKWFLDNGANPNLQNNAGTTALMYASRYSNTDSNLETVKLLLDHGADLNLQSNTGWTALILSSRYSNTTSNPETVKLLLDNGANPNIQDNNGWTALISASRHSNTTSNLETVKLLLDHGANPNLQNNKGATALMFASGESHHDSTLNTVKLLLEPKYKTDINLRDNTGKTVLMYAVSLSDKTSSLETVKLLLENGAEPYGALEECPTDKCQKIISENIWSIMKNNINNLSKQFSKSGEMRLYPDLWKLILLTKKQQQLCRQLSNDRDKHILFYFAEFLNIPISEDMTKSELCKIISRTLAWGGRYGEEMLKHLNKQQAMRDLNGLAKTLQVNVNQSINNILQDIASALNV